MTRPSALPALTLALLLALGGGSAWAQDAGQASPTPPAEEAPAEGDPDADRDVTAPVVFAGEEVARIAGVGPFTAAERAARIAARLHEVVSDRSITDVRLTVHHVENTSEIRLGTRRLMAITELDARAIGVGRRQVAAAFAEELERALRAERERYSPDLLARNAVYAVAATVGLVLALWLLVRTGRLTHRRIHAWQERRLDKLRIQQVELLSPQRVTRFVDQTIRLVHVVLVLIVLDIYLTYVLGLFPWTRSLSIALLDYALAPLVAMWEAFVGYVPSLFFLIAITVVTMYATRISTFFFDLVERERIRFERFPSDWADPTSKIVRVLLVAFALVIAFPYLPGSGSPAFAGVSVFVGVLFSLASSSSLSNMIAGLVLTYAGAFRLGDRVKIGEATGDIVERGMLATRLLTIKNEEVTIPNSIVLGAQVINYSKEAKTRGLILYTSVTIGYDAPWRQIHDLLIEAARATDGVLASPAPFVWQTALNDFYVTYEINAYTDRAQEMARIYADLHRNIQDSFYAAGVEIMSPHIFGVRDGNTIAIPEAHRAPGYEPPRFRLDHVEGGAPRSRS